MMYIFTNHNVLLNIYLKFILIYFMSQLIPHMDFKMSVAWNAQEMTSLALCNQGN